jgi:hypothetical protein
MHHLLVGLSSLRFMETWHLDPTRVTFTVILDLAHSTLDPSRVTFTAILDMFRGNVIRLVD